MHKKEEDITNLKRIINIKYLIEFYKILYNSMPIDNSVIIIIILTNKHSNFI